MTDTVECATHGSSTNTFVCSHIADGLRDGEPRGFFYSSLEAADEPCAWCLACDELFQKNGGEWTDDMEAKPELKLLCYECFLRAARQNGVLS